MMLPIRSLTRRQLLKLCGAVGVGGFASSVLQGCGKGPSSGPVPAPSACRKLTEIEHVVIFIQENRSFDHYFGSYRGVRGFADQSAAFQQSDPANTTDPPVGQLLPFHLNTATTNAACTHDITHAWVPQHHSWHNGAMDGFV